LTSESSFFASPLDDRHGRHPLQVDHQKQLHRVDAQLCRQTAALLEPGRPDLNCGQEIRMLYDPRDLTQELEDQGNTVHLDKDEYGDPVYRVILADGKLYRLSAQDMYDLKEHGKLDAAGIQEHDAEIIQRQTKY
jgi:hypothetical protein